jgi:hypothetical protein
MICPLGRSPVRPCPRKQPTGGQHNECLACLADLDERAAIVAHWQGLGAPPLSREAAMRLAVEQARAALPGAQRTIL